MNTEQTEFSTESTEKIIYVRGFGLFWVFCVLLYLAGCTARGNPFVGKWCTDAPAALLYEYRADGSVHLWIASGEYHVFRYDLPGEGALRLFDGMGRLRTYRFEVAADGITLFDPGDPTTPVDHLRRATGARCGG